MEYLKKLYSMLSSPEPERVYSETQLFSNGLCFSSSEIIVPDYVLEIIFSHLNIKDILSITQVCRIWKSVSRTRSFWKRFYINHGEDWNIIPDNVKSNPDGWIVFFMQIDRKIFTKNFVENPSGTNGNYVNWVKENGGDGWQIESPPKGCNNLPEDPLYPSNSCFASSYYWCSLWQTISLKEQGLTPKVLEICTPFSIDVEQMCASRFDCGGTYQILIMLLNEEQHPAQNFEMIQKEDALQAGMNWSKVKFNLIECLNHKGLESYQDVKFMRFILRGKDTQFWKGRYGIKFSRSQIKFKCL